MKFVFNFHLSRISPCPSSSILAQRMRPLERSVKDSTTPISDNVRFNTLAIGSQRPKTSLREHSKYVRIQNKIIEKTTNRNRDTIAFLLLMELNSVVDLTKLFFLVILEQTNPVWFYGGTR